MRRKPILAAVLIIAALASGMASTAMAGEACPAGRDDASERPAPASLLPRLGRAFGVAPATLHGGSFVRCAGGTLMGCMVGANLNCGHANSSRHSAGADAFCRDSPGADVVPMAATGHDTIYDWHCDGTHAVAGKTVAEVDRLGFMAGNWRPLR